METFIVTQGADPVGNVQRRREGLYYAMDCRCSLDGEIMYDLVMQCGDVRLNLGILVPEGDAFTLRRKLPVKSAESMLIKPASIITSMEFSLSSSLILSNRILILDGR